MELISRFAARGLESAARAIQPVARGIEKDLSPRLGRDALELGKPVAERLAKGLRGPSLWVLDRATGTANHIGVTLDLQPVAGAAEGAAKGMVHLYYRDDKGYFKGAQAISAYARLTMADGRTQEIRSLPLSLSHANTDGKVYFSGTANLALPEGSAEPTAIDLAFDSTNRWGEIKWDSDMGNNYRFNLKNH
jgi:hypothetical protein